MCTAKTDPLADVIRRVEGLGDGVALAVFGVEQVEERLPVSRRAAAQPQVLRKRSTRRSRRSHLLVGPTALRMVRETLAAQSAEIDRWEPLSTADGEG